MQITAYSTVCNDYGLTLLLGFTICNLVVFHNDILRFVEIKFVGAKLDGFQCWNAIIDSQTINVSKNETEFKLINTEHELKGGEYTDIGFTAKKFKGDPVPA